MIRGLKVLAVVPARGGSKRLPRKNVLPLNGKPLVAWSLEAALASLYVDEVYLSTDDIEIAKVCGRYGVEAEELRPSVLATDEASTEDVLFYILNKVRGKYDIVVLLQPTSPLRTSEDIDQAIELLVEKSAYSVVSVSKCEHSPLWSNVLPADCSMGKFIRPESMKRSQELPDYYRINGALYIYDIVKLSEEGKISYREDTYAHIMPQSRSVDIDEYFDFQLAELVLSNRNTD